MLFKTRNIFLDAIAVLFTVTLVMSLAVGVALSQGPVSLRHISPIINVVMAKSLALDNVDIQGAELVYDRSRGGLHLQGERIRLLDGAATYLINDFTASVSTKGVFQSFVFVPETLAAKDIIAVIKPGDEAPENAPNPSSEAEEVAELPSVPGDELNLAVYLRELRKGLSETAQLKAISYVRKIDFPNITFIFEDVKTSKVWKTSKSYALFAREGNASSLSFNFAFQSGTEKSTVNFELQQPDGQAGAGKLAVTNVRPSVIASLFPATPLLEATDVPLEGQVDFTTSAARKFATGRMVFKLAGGTLRLQNRLLPVRRAVAEAEIDFEKRRAMVNRIEYAIGPHEGYFTGSLNYAFDAYGIASDMNASLTAEKLKYQFSEDEVFNPDQLSIDLNLNLLEEKLAVKKIAFETGGGVFQIGGHLDFGNSDMPVMLDGFIEKLPIEGLKKIWPSGVAPGARKWFAKNINDGVIPSGKLKIDTSFAEVKASRRERVLRDDALALRIDLEGSRLRYLSKMPEMTDVKGSILLGGNSLEALVHKGRIEVPGDGQIMVSNSRYFEPDFNIRGNNVDIRLVLDGQVDTLVALFSRQQIGFKQANFIGDYDLQGQGRMALSLSLPVSSQVSRQERRKMMKIALDAAVQGFRVPGGVRGYDISSPFISFTYRGDKLGVESDVIVNGVPFEVSLTEEFVNLKRNLSKLSVQAELTEYDFANLNLDSLSKRVRGRLPLRFDLVRDRQGHIDVNFRADMTKTAMRLSPLAYEKEVGRPADLRFTSVLSGDREFENVKLSLIDTDVIFEASAVFEDGRLETLSIPSINPDGKGNAAILLDRSQDKRLFSLSGTYFDMSQFTQSKDFGRPAFTVDNPEYVLPEDILPDQDKDQEQGGGSDAIAFDQLFRGDMDIKVDVGHLQGNNGVHVDNFVVDADLRNGLFERVIITGNTSSNNSLLFDLHRETPKNRVYTMRMKQVDEVFKALGTLDNMQDGELVLSGQLMNEAGKGEGTLYISEFMIPELPTLAKILTLGSLKGISDTIQNDGLYIRTAELEYRHKGQLFEVESLVANGPALGITMEGIIDRGQDQLFLDGTLVPAYSLNSFLGRIPIIGVLFSGGQGGGLLGLSYDIAGPINKPEISVNPLSLFTPGFIRNIFRVRIFGPSKPKFDY
ncbi:MAG: AsmA-like C-terminal domain-containing protein [Parvibaculales bacterium]